MSKSNSHSDIYLAFISVIGMVLILLSLAILIGPVRILGDNPTAVVFLEYATALATVVSPFFTILASVSLLHAWTRRRQPSMSRWLLRASVIVVIFGVVGAPIFAWQIRKLIGVMVWFNNEGSSTAPPIQITPDARRTENEAYQQGLRLKETFQMPEAVIAFRKAVLEEPNSPLAHYELGIALKKTNHLDDGVKELEKAIALCPTHAEALEELLKTYSYAGAPTDVDRIRTLLARVDPQRAAKWSR